MKSEKDLLTQSLVDLYREMDALKDVGRIALSADGYVSRFNKLLAAAKQAYPEMHAIANIQETEPMRARGIAQLPELSGEAPPKFSDTKLKTKEILNILGIDPTAPKNMPPPSQVVQVNIQLGQWLNLSLDQLIQTIQQQSLSQTVRDEAEAAVRMFGDEINKPAPDPSRLKEGLDKVVTIGKEYSLPLLLLLLQHWDKIFHS
jgi:hypothetical protein